MTRDKFGITWGDTGNQPPDGDDFQSGEKPDAQHFDWKWYNTLNKINKLWDEFTRIDSDDDGVVDKADYANDGNASTYKDNDIDSDGDGQVNSADVANETKSFEARTNYPTSPSNGQVVFRTDKT